MNAANDPDTTVTVMPTGPMRLVGVGRVMWRLGQPEPPRPADDEDRTDRAYLWYGWMLARATYLQKCWMVKNSLEDDDPWDPRPPEAAPRMQMAA